MSAVHSTSTDPLVREYFAQVAYGSAHALGWFMLIATLIPIADALIVLHHGGSRTVAFGVHGGTAVAMLIISGLLLVDR